MGNSGSISLRRNPFDGILARISRDCEGNPHQKGIIEITTSSKGPRTIIEIDAILDPKNEHEWVSANEQNSWIQFDFKEKRIKLENYAIMTFSGQQGSTHMKSWRLEASEDDIEWVILDDVKDDNTLNSSNAVITRATKTDQFYRYFKFTQTDKNQFGTYCMAIRRIEFFGVLQ
ncbi:F5/8 type C domain containing protein [Histomonas meleagridis]|uniref:F5/8 type C domain containing protein n=1 Tax=Histomonas meleagridis TaxID=135588 RepID=UPI00355A3750|nr:F5/8 type C domain containing protein [Histomonas meleagridis]KAH0796489.1 F5/8 type C domain containing protein [Histomonas meleagridis]